MHVKVLRPFLGKEGVVTEGKVIEVSEGRANELQRHGLVAPLTSAKDTRTSDPIKPRRTGGPTGADTQQSSSPLVPRPPKRTSTPRARRARKS